MADERTPANSVPRSTLLRAERGTLHPKHGTARGTPSGTAQSEGRQTPAPKPATDKAKRNDTRNVDRKGRLVERSACKSERNALAKAGVRPGEAPPYAPSRVFPVRVLTGATQAEQAQQVASDLTAPEAAATRVILAAEGKSVAGEWLDVPGTLAELRRVASQVNAGDLSHAEAMLVNQAQAMQSLSTRLIERGLSQDGLAQFEAFMRLGLRAQSQSRQALETLAVLKQGPAVFARQANIAHGPQQVVNGPAPPPLACAAAEQNSADPTIIAP